MWIQHILICIFLSFNALLDYQPRVRESKSLNNRDRKAGHWRSLHPRLFYTQGIIYVCREC